MKLGQLIEYNIRNIFLKSHPQMDGEIVKKLFPETPQIVKKLFPDAFVKNWYEHISGSIV